MGGGAVLRGLGRAITMGGASVRGGIGSAAQQVVTPKKSWAATKASVSSSASCYVAPEEEGFVEEWEFAGEGEGDGLQTWHHQVQLDQQPLVRDRIIFGTAPTRQEVVEATSDLRNVLKQTTSPVSDTFGHELVSSSLLSVHDKPDSVEVSNMQDTDNTYSENLVNQVEPEFGQDNEKILQKSGHSDVFEAFNLLQSNPCVQGMVISLASDEAVWEALLKNEKVIEFRQQLLKGESELPETNKDTGKPSPGKHPFVQAIDTVKAKVIDYMGRITEICSQFFGVADKRLSDKDPEFVKTLKTSWMLCIAVLLIVLVKRI